jgi:hypothetical protein
MNLTFHQWPWIKVVIKVMALPWVQCNNSVKYYSNSWTQWKVMAWTSKTTIGIVWPWPLTSDLGSRLWHFLWSGVTILWNFIPIHAFNGNLWPGQCLNHYEHSDIDLWTITLDQGHDTSLGPGQQSCAIFFQFIKRVRSYGQDKLFVYVLTILCIVTLTFDQWCWIKVITLPCVQCNNSVKYYSNPSFQCKIMAWTMFKP